MASNDMIVQDITAFSNINDFLQHFTDESAVSSYIESITYDVKAQTVIIQMQKLVKEEAEVVAMRHNEGEDLADEKIKRLSEHYKNKFPELLGSFKEWKPVREKLVQLLRLSSDNLDRNSFIVNFCRVVASATDIFGTLARAGGKSDKSWADFAMEHASTFGLFSLLLEMTLSKKMHREVKMMIKQDQELFKKIADWFKQTEELDCAVKSFFPYGIDPDITKKIAKSSSSFDDYNKIFMSIVASNVRKNVRLFKDKSFLKNADRISASEAGKQWFQKVILENDLNFGHCLNSKLSEDIQDILKISPTENSILLAEAYSRLSEKVKMKVMLNVMTIISSVYNLLGNYKLEESEVLKELSEKTKTELEEIQKVILFLKPSGFELDPVLQ